MLLNITNSNQLMTEIPNDKLNDILKSIHQRTFHQRTIQKLMILISGARKLPASTYTTPSEEIFDKYQVTGDDKELDDINNTNEELREFLLQSTLDMKKTFLVRWTNEVFAKFLANPNTCSITSSYCPWYIKSIIGPTRIPNNESFYVEDFRRCLALFLYWMQSLI